eukprot:TRINITY_DN3334_c1_g1_i1.p1 TRINITY_DN3334_c1_g1~~TRINITY_DN3334_c1_g1_i1.p1  ORF type:complete len:655 (-),score=105.18 TRINITY_DN3334_c1_g1_i1:22-1851(-)
MSTITLKEADYVNINNDNNNGGNHEDDDIDDEHEVVSCMLDNMRGELYDLREILSESSSFLLTDMIKVRDQLEYGALLLVKAAKIVHNGEDTAHSNHGDHIATVGDSCAPSRDLSLSPIPNDSSFRSLQSSSTMESPPSSTSSLPSDSTIITPTVTRYDKSALPSSHSLLSTPPPPSTTTATTTTTSSYIFSPSMYTPTAGMHTSRRISPKREGPSRDQPIYGRSRGFSEDVAQHDMPQYTRPRLEQKRRMDDVRNVMPHKRDRVPFYGNMQSQYGNNDGGAQPMGSNFDRYDPNKEHHQHYDTNSNNNYSKKTFYGRYDDDKPLSNRRHEREPPSRFSRDKRARDDIYCGGTQAYNAVHGKLVDLLMEGGDVNMNLLEQVFNDHHNTSKQQMVDLIREVSRPGIIIDLVRESDESYNALLRFVNFIPVHLVGSMCAHLGNEDLRWLAGCAQGCRVLQSFVQQANGEYGLVRNIVEHVLARFIELGQHLFGNFIVQEVIKYSEYARAQVSTILSGHVAELSVNPFGTYVVIACYKHCDQKTKSNMTEEIIGRVDKLLYVKEGSYVLQAALKNSPEYVARELARRLLPHLGRTGPHKFVYGTIMKLGYDV